MKKVFAVCLAISALVLTGCPRNQYIVELKPRGAKIERKLTFYCEDGTNGYKNPDIRQFAPEELEEITKLYPADAHTQQGEKHIAKAEFGNVLPADVGGSGSYTNIVTSLGSFGFYAERFRGETDLAAQLERRLAATDRMAEYAIGWMTQELKQEPGFENLRKFLDGDFRKDMKNLCLYAAQSTFASTYQTNTLDEYIVRFGQYLMEHGYFKFTELPHLAGAVSNHNDPEAETKFYSFIQRLVARKLGISESAPIPASLAFLADGKAADKSLENYLQGTEMYQQALKLWEQARALDPNLHKPTAIEAAYHSTRDMADIGFLWPEPRDRLMVKLSLPVPPSYSNGRWDETNNVVIWEAELDNRTNATRMPVFCYASWVEPDERFQKEHFGEVRLNDDYLGRYCVWRAGLSEQRAVEWEAFLNKLKPGKGFEKQVSEFRFSDEPESSAGKPEMAGASECARSWLSSGTEKAGAKK